MGTKCAPRCRFIFFLFYYESYAVAKSHPMIYQGCRGCDSMVA
jgi:hypothetical protein